MAKEIHHMGKTLVPAKGRVDFYVEKGKAGALYHISALKAAPRYGQPGSKPDATEPEEPRNQAAPKRKKAAKKRR